jgi:hypothetical protein
MMTSECDSALRLAFALVGETPAQDLHYESDVEVAFQHLKRCASCRSSFTLEELGVFFNAVLLERE